MAYKQKNNPFNRPTSSSLNMSSAFKAVAPTNPVKLEEPKEGPEEKEAITGMQHDEEGNLIKEEIWENGELIEPESELDESGFSDGEVIKSMQY